MRDVYVTIEVWPFVCLRCGHSWDEEYEARRTCDISGGEVVTWRRSGFAGAPPWSGRTCPNCSGLRVKLLPRRTSPHDPPQLREPQETPGPPASQT